MSQTLAKHRRLEILEVFNGYQICLDLGTYQLEVGMGSDPISKEEAEKMLNTPYLYAELLEAYFPDIDTV